MYYTFKALNDKWVSGRDFKERTLFEDVLILDTAKYELKKFNCLTVAFRNNQYVVLEKLSNKP